MYKDTYIYNICVIIDFAFPLFWLDLGQYKIDFQIDFFGEKNVFNYFSSKNDHYTIAIIYYIFFIVSERKLCPPSAENDANQGA